MKKVKCFSFINKTIVGGLIFLVPIIALVIFFGKAPGITRTIVGPLIAVIHTKTIGGCGSGDTSCHYNYCIVLFFCADISENFFG